MIPHNTTQHRTCCLCSYSLCWLQCNINFLFYYIQFINIDLLFDANTTDFFRQCHSIQLIEMEIFASAARIGNLKLIWRSLWLYDRRARACHYSDVYYSIRSVVVRGTWWEIENITVTFWCLKMRIHRWLEEVRLVDPFDITKARCWNDFDCIRQKCSVDNHTTCEWHVLEHNLFDECVMRKCVEPPSLFSRYERFPQRALHSIHSIGGKHIIHEHEQHSYMNGPK